MTLKELLRMRIYSFVNFEDLIYMKVYSVIILNKIQKYKINNGKALKKTKLALFPRLIFYVNKFAYIIGHYRPPILTISDGMIKVTT